MRRRFAAPAAAPVEPQTSPAAAPKDAAPMRTGFGPLDAALARAAEVRRSRAIPTDVDPALLVGLYSVGHHWLYGVHPEELGDARQWSDALRAAAKMIGRLGPSEAAAAVVWVMDRERRRQTPREQRIGWRLALGGALVTDYLVALSRAGEPLPAPGRAAPAPRVARPVRPARRAPSESRDALTPGRRYFAAAAAVQQSSLAERPKHLLLSLLLAVDGRSGETFIGQAELARRMSCSARAVRAAVAELRRAVATGESPLYVTWTHRAGVDGQGRGSDLVRITPTQAANCAAMPPDPTGRNRRPNRQESTTQPANCAGDPLSIPSLSAQRAEEDAT